MRLQFDLWLHLARTEQGSTLFGSRRTPVRILEEVCTIQPSQLVTSIRRYRGMGSVPSLKIFK